MGINYPQNIENIHGKTKSFHTQHCKKMVKEKISQSKQMKLAC